MKGTEAMQAILDREELSITKVSREMGHGKAYLNTLIGEGRECKLSTLVGFCEATGYEIVVRSTDDGFEIPIG